MPKKDLGPLQQSEREGDVLKKKVDDLQAEWQALLEDSTVSERPDKQHDLYDRASDIEDEVLVQLKKVKKLQAENEPIKVKGFNDKKQEEVKRLEALKEVIQNLADKLEPDEVEDEYYREQLLEKEQLEEDEDQSLENDEKKNEKKKESELKKEDQKEASDKNKADKKDEIVKADKDEKSGDKDETQVKDPTENEEYEDDEEYDDEDDDLEDEYEDDASEDEDYTDEEDDEETGEEDYDTTAQFSTMQQFEALEDFTEEAQKGDLEFLKGDILTVLVARSDGWWEAENKDGEKGLVPSTLLKVYRDNKYAEVQEQDEPEEDPEEVDPEQSLNATSPRSGKFLWSSIRKSVKETSVTDVLQAMGALPSGFRKSTLGELHSQDHYRMINSLAPKLSASCLSYKDLFFDPATNKIRPRAVRIQKIVSLSACRQIPLPGTGVDIVDRYVRICLFDGVKMLSNVHTIRVSSVDKEQKTWSFNTKITDIMKTVEHGECFIRSNTTETNIGILFELCMSYVRTSNGDRGEFSCGWVNLPLYDQGMPVANKTFDLYVNGGTPFEKGVEVDPSISRKASTSRFRTLMSGNKQPRLIVKISQANKEQKDQLDTLPDVLVSNMCYVPFLSFYRQILADALLRDRVDMYSADLIHSPLLASLPTAVDQPDLMDALRTNWIEKLKLSKRADKKDNEALKELFTKVFLETVYPLLHVATLPPYTLGNRDTETKRLNEMNRILKIGKSKNAMVAALLSPDVVYEPFDISEVSFDVLGPFCTAKTA